MQIKKVFLFLNLSFVTMGWAQAEEPWESIFNGVDFDGWSVVCERGVAYVADSAFVCHQVSNTYQHTFIRTNRSYGNFILELDCLLEGNFHTGVLFRCIDAPDTASVCMYGYQVKIDPTPRRWTGGVFDDFGKTWHWLYDLKEDERARSAFELNQWNHFRIEAIDSLIKVWVNDIPTTHMINPKYDHGTIALKIHSMGLEPEREKIHVYYKNIRILSENPEKYAREMDIPAKICE